MIIQKGLLQRVFFRLVQGNNAGRRNWYLIKSKLHSSHSGKCEGVKVKMNFSYKLAIFFGLMGFLILIAMGAPIWQPIIIIIGIIVLILSQRNNWKRKG